MTKAVFLDRDGVINEVLVKNDRAYSPRRFEEFKFIENVYELIRKIKEAGFLSIVVTNQPDIARGKMEISELERMNKAVRDKLPIDDNLVCMHDDIDNCSCRKPKPGMIFKAAKKYEIEIETSFLIGDGWRDMMAASNAGCKGILLKASYNTGVDCFKRVENLKTAIDTIVDEKGA